MNYTYSTDGKLSTVTDSTGTTTFEYNNMDGLTRVEYPDGSYVSYSYDTSCRLGYSSFTKISAWASTKITTSPVKDTEAVNPQTITSKSGVGNPVDVAGKGSTGRTTPNSLNEQIAMEQVKSNPLKNATDLSTKGTIMGDTRWPASKGWVKMSVVVKNSDGSQTVIHYVYNTNTGVYDDFKFVN